MESRLQSCGNVESLSIKQGDRMKFAVRSLAVAAFLTGTVSTTLAAPSPTELADRIQRAQAEWLEDVESVTMTTEIVGGFVTGITSTTRMRKEMRDGRPVLVDADDASDLLSGAATHDQMLIDMVRAARSVSDDQLAGHRVYRVLVDDVSALRDIGGSDAWNEDAGDVEPKQATLWVDQRQLILRKISMLMAKAEGGEMTIDMDFSDFTTVRGLPIARSMKMTMQGLQQMISAAELAEMRQAMAQMQQQLEQMPEAQRAMMEGMMAPQMAEFEKMISSGGTTMEMRVTDIEVN
jgi:hypothetical protein